MEPSEFKKLVIEAILFSSSRFVSIDELSKTVMLSKEEVIRIIEGLNKEYEKHAFRIINIGDKYKIQLKEEFYDIAKEFMESPLNEDELKLVSALVSLKRIEALKAFRLLGKAYTEVLESLSKKGIIKVVYENRRKYIVPGERFQEFVNIDSLELSAE